MRVTTAHKLFSRHGNRREPVWIADVPGDLVAKIAHVIGPVHDAIPTVYEAEVGEGSMTAGYHHGARCRRFVGASGRKAHQALVVGEHGVRLSLIHI